MHHKLGHVTLSDLWTPPICPARAGSSHRSCRWPALAGSATLGWSPVWGRCCWRWARKRCRSAAWAPAGTRHTHQHVFWSASDALTLQWTSPGWARLSGSPGTGAAGSASARCCSREGRAERCRMAPAWTSLHTDPGTDARTRRNHLRTMKTDWASEMRHSRRIRVLRRAWL